VLDLVYRGAKLEGTENGKLLMQEYNHLQKIVQEKNNPERNKLIDEYNRASSDLLLERDQFIANRIDHTLGEGESGVLFMGMMHEVDRFLPKGIAVSYLIHRLPFGKADRHEEKLNNQS
jgi:hypothetical protein